MGVAALLQLHVLLIGGGGGGGAAVVVEFNS